MLWFLLFSHGLSIDGAEDATHASTAQRLKLWTMLQVMRHLAHKIDQLWELVSFQVGTGPERCKTHCHRTRPRVRIVVLPLDMHLSDIFHGNLWKLDGVMRVHHIGQLIPG